NAAIGTTASLKSLTISPGRTVLNGGLVKTAGDQLYDCAVVLGTDTVLTSGGSIGISGVVSPAGASNHFALKVTAGGDITFRQAVDSLSSLSTEGGGSVSLQ